MSNEAVGLLTFLVVLIAGLSMLTASVLDRRLNKYEDTVAEYVMCIEYNPDCECSDIILSEYGEEVENE